MPQHDEPPTGHTADQDTQAAHTALPDSSGQQPETDTTSAGSEAHDAQTATLTPEDAQRAEAIDTQRAAAGDEAPTELIADRPLPDTVSATAWSQTDDHPDNDGNDGNDGNDPHEDAEHERSRWPWRAVIGLAAGVFTILAIIATSLAFGGWGLEQRRQVEVEPVTIKPSPTPTPAPTPTVAAAPAPPSIAKHKYLGHTLTDQITYKDSTKADWGKPTPDTALTIEASCNGSHCTLVTTPDDTPNNALTYVWSDGAWHTEPIFFSSCAGSTDEETLAITPGPNGSLHGTQTVTMISATPQCSMGNGASSTVPFILEPIIEAT